MPTVETLESGNVRVVIPITLRCKSGRKRVIAPDVMEKSDDPLLLNIVRAFRWQSLVDNGSFASIHELSNYIGRDYAYTSRIMRLTMLAPEIVHHALVGT